jgi:hypothetical protein
LTPIRVSSTSIADAPISGSRDKVMKPCAIGAPNGPRLRPLDVDVDPLVVVGGVGEELDPRLGDLDPVAVGDVLADQGLRARRAWRKCASISPRP